MPSVDINNLKLSFAKVKARALVLTMLCAFALSTSLPLTAMPFSLKSLNDSADSIVENQTPSKAGVATITMIYQPDCSWCKKQGIALAKAFEQCQQSINIALVGTKGSARQLRKELVHYHPSIPAFIADRKFLRTIGGYEASPTTLVFDGQGQLLAKKRGFIPDDKLASALAMLSQGECQI